MTREKAIEVVKEAMPTLWKETKEAIQTLIPELAENEDEKIRKEMIEFLNQYKEDGLRGVDITPWIAYLEKQKEQKQVEWSEEDEIIERIKSVIEKYLPGREKQLNTSDIDFGPLFSGEWEVFDYVYDVIQDTSEDSKEKLERIRKYLRTVKDNLAEFRITNEWTPRKTGMDYAVGDIEVVFKEIQEK